MLENSSRRHPSAAQDSLGKVWLRGHLEPEPLRRSFEAWINPHTHRYYRLQDEIGHYHFMLEARLLPTLIEWFLMLPRLEVVVDFIGKRRRMKSNKYASIAGLSDADFLAIAKVGLPKMGISLYFYDRTPVTGFHRSRVRGAPMRDINLNALTEPYLGHCFGVPACAMSPTQISLPDTRQRRLNLSSETAPDSMISPIDVVYTWVDADDPKWQAKFADHVGTPSTASHASKLRYISREELRYSIRSILKHAPWVRNIYIVSDDQTPRWFKRSDRVKIVSHREIFPDPSVLPVFNSHAIESCLHRIPGLSEHFIYFNDDVFLGQSVEPTDFFGPDGAVKLFFSGHLSLNPEFVAVRPLMTDAAFRNTIRIIEDRFGFTPIAKVLHTPHPMRKSILQMIEDEHADELSLTRAARVRSETDLNMTGNLAYYYYLGLDLADWHPRGPGFYRHLDTGALADQDAFEVLAGKPNKFFCLNLTDKNEVSLEKQAQRMKKLVMRLFPTPAEHER